MNIIARAAICIYDGTPSAPIFPDSFGALGETACAYLSAAAEKIISGDGSRLTGLLEGSDAEPLLRDFTVRPFPEAARALLLYMDGRLQDLEIRREGFDLVVFTFDREGEPYLGVAQLIFKNAVAHRLVTVEDGLRTELGNIDAVMPAPGGKACSGFVCSLSTGDIRLKDTSVMTNLDNRQLFSEALFEMASTRTTKESIRAVEEAIRQAAPEIPEQELKPAVKSAMSRSIEEKGVIDIQEVAGEVFRSDEDREALVAQVTRQVMEENIEPVIPVENKRVLTQMQKLKIRTDTGISITMPRTLADDESSFAVVNNDDGTISIIIGKVQQIQTE